MQPQNMPQIKINLNPHPIYAYYISHIIISHRTTFINQDKKETKVVEHKKEALLETRHTKTVLNVVQRRF